MLNHGVIDQDSFDLIVVGGGPAGMSAAAQAATLGLTVALIDERVTLGGQIYKQLGPGFHVKNEKLMGREYVAGRGMIGDIAKQNINVYLKTLAVSIEGSRIVIVPEGGKAQTLTGRRILLAPGAHDRPVAFPGWTLPGVITAGGAQTLVKTQRVVPGERILFAGSGPLALAFPAQLKKYGANIVMALEAGRAPGIAVIVRLIFASPRNGRLLLDALKYRWFLVAHRVPIQYKRIILEVGGQGRVEYAIHAKVDRDWRPIPGTEERIEVDTVCIGYGFFPSVELFRLAGCQLGYDENLGGPTVVTDSWGRTSNNEIFAAGDGTGVEGVYVAVARGRIAALKIAEDLDCISGKQADRMSKSSFRQIAAKRRFQRVLARMFAVGVGIYQLADKETTICRCENVRKGRIDEVISTTSDLSVIKAFTRAGMGLCQGRNCQRQIAALISNAHSMDISDVPVATPRFPVKPVPLGAIADEGIQDEKYFIDA